MGILVFQYSTISWVFVIIYCIASHWLIMMIILSCQVSIQFIDVEIFQIDSWLQVIKVNRIKVRKDSPAHSTEDETGFFVTEIRKHGYLAQFCEFCATGSDRVFFIFFARQINWCQQLFTVINERWALFQLTKETAAIKCFVFALYLNYGWDKRGLCLVDTARMSDSVVLKNRSALFWFADARITARLHCLSNSVIIIQLSKCHKRKSRITWRNL